MKTTDGHPLRHIVIDYLQQHSEIDITNLADEIGTPTEPPDGVACYRQVAADILCWMEIEGDLERGGLGDPNRPELGGFFWKLANNPTNP